MSRARDTANIVDLPNAKGDIFGASAADTPARVAVGTNGTFLTADSTQTTGVSWTAVDTFATNFLYMGA